MSLLSHSSEIQLSSVAFFGRGFAEYCQFLRLDPAALQRRSVLDVAAGPSTFTLDACRQGARAVAVDPLYGCSIGALATHVQLDYARMFEQLRRKPHLVRVGDRPGSGAAHFPSIAAAEQDRRGAAERFLNDYEDGFLQGRYVGASLPRLPFADQSFDLVLCAHLLFLYAAQFNYAWHLAACRELVRVSAGEVRIHPICGLDGLPSPHLDQIQRDLAAVNISSRIVPLDYEFFVGARAMLVLSRC